MRSLCALAACAVSSLTVTLAAAAADQPAPEHVRGVVVSLDGRLLKVQPRAGMPVLVKLADDAGVAVADKADLSSVADGAFIGTTAVPDAGGKLRALEIHVFAESMRGTGEGHRPWDLKPGSSMTNATVAGSAHAMGKSSMTNATVSKMSAGGAGKTLSLKYSGGEQVVVVPSGTPVVKVEPGDLSALTPGAHVFVIAVRQGDGSLVAPRLIVGKNGITPPM
jgi:hypothetical protein